MKISVLVFFLSVIVLIGCNSKPPEAPNEEQKIDSTTQTVQTDSLTLSTKQEAQIVDIHNQLKEVYDFSLAETRENFRKDLNVSHELRIWEQMAEAYTSYVNDHEQADLDVKKEAYKLILLRSMMSSEQAMAQAQLKTLTVEQAAEVLEYYKDRPDPINAAKI